MTIEGWGGHGGNEENQEENESISPPPREKKKTIVLWNDSTSGDSRYHLCEWYDDVEQVIFNLKRRNIKDLTVFELGEERKDIVEKVIVP